MGKKWPGVFTVNVRRKAVANSEVIMRWKGYAKSSQWLNDSVRSQQKKLEQKRERPKLKIPNNAGPRQKVKKPFLKIAAKPKALAMKDIQKLEDQQNKIEARIQQLAEATPKEKTEERFSLLMDEFREYLQGRELKEESARAYLASFRLLFKRDFRSYKASAGEEYMALIKASPHNKKAHGQYHSAVSHFMSFYQARANVRSEV